MISYCTGPIAASALLTSDDHEQLRSSNIIVLYTETYSPLHYDWGQCCLLLLLCQQEIVPSHFASTRKATG